MENKKLEQIEKLEKTILLQQEAINKQNEELSELRKIVEKENEKSDCYEHFMPEDKKEYYAIKTDYQDDLKVVKHYNNSFDVTKVQAGQCNTFETKEEADKALEKMLLLLKGVSIMKWINKNWKPDWSNEVQNKYIIYLNSDKDNVETSYVYNEQDNLFYFESKKDAKKFIELFGESNIKILFNGIYD